MLYHDLGNNVESAHIICKLCDSAPNPALLLFFWLVSQNILQQYNCISGFQFIETTNICLFIRFHVLNNIKYAI